MPMNIQVKFFQYNKTKWIALCTLLFLISFKGFSSDTIFKVLPEFSKLKIQGRLVVILEIGTDYKAELRASSAEVDLNKVAFNNKGDEMLVKYSGLTLKGPGVQLVITIPSLNQIDVSMGAKVSVQSRHILKTATLELNVSGGGVIIGALDVELLTASIDGGGDVILSGATKQLIASVLTGGTIDGFNLITNNASAKVKLGGNVNVNVKETLNASVFSGGIISYKGSPALTQKVSLGGLIQKVNDVKTKK